MGRIEKVEPMPRLFDKGGDAGDARVLHPRHQPIALNHKKSRHNRFQSPFPTIRTRDPFYEPAAPAALRHRIRLSAELEIEGYQPDDVLADILAHVEAPSI